MRILRLLIVSLFLFGPIVPSHAQIFKKLKKKVEKKVGERVDKKGKEADKEADKKMDEGMDKAEEGVEEAILGSGGNSEQKRASGEAGGAEMTGEAESKGMGDIDTGYDFEPGKNTLFETDFSGATVGNFPGNLEFRGGNMSVVSYNEGRALLVKTTGQFAVDLKKDLPDNFTLRFDVNTKIFVNDFYVKIVDDDYEPVGNYTIKVDGYDGTGLKGVEKGAFSALEREKIIYKEVTPIRVMVDGDYAKVYVGQKRVANIPNVDLGRTSKILFDFTDVREAPIYVTNIRIAGEGRSLYQTLESEGRIAIHDIHFATGKADILPESLESLQEIAKLLNDHAELQVMIEGHTDNTGDFDKNMKLSKDRAASVKSYLIDNFDVDVDRMRSMGQGQTQPVAPNDSEEGRAKNRRVEIAKI